MEEASPQAMHVKNFLSETDAERLMEEASPQAMHVKNFLSETDAERLMENVCRNIPDEIKVINVCDREGDMAD
jgi:hypothetical protein